MAYLTPDNPVNSRVISISVPDTIEPYFWGSIAEMLNPCHWEQNGAMTPGEVAQACNVLIQEVNPLETLLFVENIASLHSYTFWVEPFGGAINPLTALTDGFIGPAELGSTLYVDFHNDEGYLAVVFDFGEPVNVLRGEIFGKRVLAENVNPPYELALYCGDTLETVSKLVGVATTLDGTDDRDYHFSVSNPLPLVARRWWVIAPFVHPNEIVTALSEVKIIGVRSFA